MPTFGIPAAPGENGTQSAKRGKRILLVEDHEVTRTTVARLLHQRGYEVVGAHSLADARRCAAESSFDLIVSDLGLPDGDGCELMKELRAAHARPPAGIAISGFGMEDDVTRARAAGFTEHLTKPITVQSLEGVLRRLIQ